MLPKLTSETLTLSYEQEFLLLRYAQVINETSLEELRTNLLETTRQLMIKENVILVLVKASI